MDIDMEADPDEVVESQLNHVILPRVLPTYESSEHEVRLIKDLMDTVIESNEVPKKTHHLCRLFQRFAIKSTEDSIHSAINGLRPGDTFGMFIKMQNTVLMIYIPEGQPRAPQSQLDAILATFPGSVAASETYKCQSDLEFTYPAQAFKVKFSSLMRSIEFAHELYFLNEVVPKQGQSKNYVSHWLTTILAGENCVTATQNEFPAIVKKIRNERIGASKLNRFRRSRLYMSAKVVIQHSLTMQLGAETGKFRYKVLMLKFMSEICYPFVEPDRDLDIDLMTQIVAKMARRIEKLLAYAAQPNEIMWRDSVIERTKEVIETIRTQINEQIHGVQKEKKQKARLPVLSNLNFDADTRHEMKDLLECLDERNAIESQSQSNVKYEVKSYTRYFRRNRANPSVETINVIKTDIELRVYWLEFENQVLYEMEMDETELESDEIRKWLFGYLKYAEEYYKNNQLFASRMMLVHLKLIRILDHLALEMYPSLANHRTGINPKVIESLLIPQQIDMQIAHELEKYFVNRNKKAHEPALSEEKAVTSRSFSVRFASEDYDMQLVRNDILRLDRENVERKEKEWTDERGKCEDLRAKAKRMQHSYVETINGNQHSNSCARCKTKEKADAIEIEDYEHLLPEAEQERWAIVFELRIPPRIACLRDAVYRFTKACGVHTEQLDIKCNWKDCPAFAKYNRSTSEHVMLGTTIKQSRSKYHVDQPFERFIIANTSNCMFHVSRKSISSPVKDDTLKNICTFKTADEYKGLQYALNTTAHTQNEVLSRQSESPYNLSLAEYKHFGSLRADGHRLQLRNIYAVIAQEALSFEKESVASLILQSIWELGIGGDADHIRESHEDFAYPNFCREKIKLLQKFVDQQRNNWVNPLKLLTVTAIAARIFEINDEEEVATSLVQLFNEIRTVTLDWIVKIETAIHEMPRNDEANERNLRFKLIWVAITGGLTYFVHPKHRFYDQIFSDSNENEAVSSAQTWLRLVITLKNNVHMYVNEENQLPSMLQMFLRVIEMIGIHLEQQMKGLLAQDKDGVIELVQKQWTRAENGRFSDMHFNDTYPHILVVSAKVGATKQTVTIDIISGLFLVDGLPLTRLPRSTTCSDIYKWFFGNVSFEVQPDGLKTFSTVQKYNDCTYEFTDHKSMLIIVERHANGTVKELLHHEKLMEEFPHSLVTNYSHWWNKTNNSIEFRAKTTADKHFTSQTDIDYRLDLETKQLQHLKTQRFMIDINSKAYGDITTQLKRLEHPKFIHIMMIEPTVATVELIRMNLKFRIFAKEQQQSQSQQQQDQEFVLQSNEFSGMCVTREQNVGTLYGLQHGLVLENLGANAVAKTRILLIPHGSISAKLNNPSDEVATVRIETEESLRNPPFYRYQVDEFCQQLKAANTSHAAWFYLAYLHAVTSHGEIEPFLGMSGTERALQILQSGFAWSSAPYETEAIELLHLIAKLSPSRKLTDNVQSVCWPEGIPARAAQDSFVFIARKLLQDSQRLHGLYFNDSGQDLKFKTDLKLNERDYRRCLALQPNFCVNNEFISRKSLQTSLPEIRPFFMGRDTQTVAVLYHNGGYQVPIDFDLKSFLTSSKKPLYVFDSNEKAKDFNHNITDDIRELWIGLYNEARKTGPEKLSAEKFALILSLLAHQNKDIGAILALQCVWMNPDEFRQINVPPGGMIRLTNAVYTPAKVRKIIQKHCKLPNALNNTEYKSIEDDIAATVKRDWPCQSIDITRRYPKNNMIDFVAANKTLNSDLRLWYTYHQLLAFCTDFHTGLRRVRNNSIDQLILPRFSPFVTNAPKIFQKFQLDIDAKMQENIETLSDALIIDASVAYENETQDSLRTADEWWAEIESISNVEGTKHLKEAGLMPRIVPSLMLPKIQNSDTNDGLKALIGAWAVTIARDQREKRILIYGQRPELQAAMQNEQQNEPHVNWKPCERPEWLLFEIEQNLTIRRIQIEIAKRMIEPPERAGSDAKHSVMQLNMGEGKTAVIVPILAAVLADGTQACQVTVLKSLFSTNLKSLRQYLGGMLNRRVYTFPCRRDMAVGRHINDILDIYKECQIKRGVILTLPDYRLSFQLKIYESIEKGDFEASKRFLNVYKWINANVRNVLDESDAILQANYQLVYTVGQQLPPDSGSQRWNIIQAVLKAVPYHMRQLSEANPTKIEFDHNYVAHGHVYGPSTMKFRSDVFTPCRFLDVSIFEQLKIRLINNFLDGRLDIVFPEMPEAQRNQIRQLLSQKVTDDQLFEMVKLMSATDQHTIFILRGLLHFEVLRLVLTKRWRVNYGVDPKGRRRMAVPFKAKDVAAEMTEFGHPDVAICFTQMSYYYSGLTDFQLRRVFAILGNKQDGEAIYEKWLSSITPSLIDRRIAVYSGINLDDPNQRDELLFPLLRYNMNVIDFWLSNDIYPHEAKTFAQKLMCSSWDLCSDQLQHCTTGFSGTNDTKSILPLPVEQNDLAELESTNERMREVLLRKENQSYSILPPNISGRQTLQLLVRANIPVLLDSGALMLDLTNNELAIEWLKLTSEDDFDAAVYFDAQDVLQTIDRNGTITEFDCSVYRDNLQRCLVYLDDVHTRGTDLKFPLNWRACVTLSGDITRDKTVQSCMRMRQLGTHHSICFWASNEADIRIRKLCNIRSDLAFITNEHVIRLIEENSRQFVENNMVHWTASGLNYTKKSIAHHLFENSEEPEKLKQFYRICVDQEYVKLMEMYGKKDEMFLWQVANMKFSKLTSPRELADAMNAEAKVADVMTFVGRVQSKVMLKAMTQAPNVKQFSHVLDEEQEKELEQELEEAREVERPPAVKAAKPSLCKDLKRLVERGATDALITTMKTKHELLSIPESLAHTQLHQPYQLESEAWNDRLLVTKDFKVVIEGTSKACDEFLRPVWWIARIQHQTSDNHFLVVLSPHEVNRLMPSFRESPVATLFMYRPKLSKLHSNLLEFDDLQVSNMEEPQSIGIQEEVQIGLYAGSMYFNTEEEQNAYCAFTGLIPRPRTLELERAFQNNVIKPKGYVPKDLRDHSQAIRDCVGECKFQKNPVDLAIKLCEAHHQALLKESHVASILERGMKMGIEDDIKQEPMDVDD